MVQIHCLLRIQKVPQRPANELSFDLALLNQGNKQDIQALED